jgi:multidrug efflux pump subunit AcrA (membrane-fusion protein)
MNIQLQTSAPREAPDAAAEAVRLAALLEERRAELSALQEEFREFKERYARTVGGCLTELAEVEAEIRRAEARLAGLEEEEEADEEGRPDFEGTAPSAAPGRGGLRKLFWSVARMFHPDHAADEEEARRRHAIMAEASRAYRDGDAESLSTLLDDEQLQSYCASGAREEVPEDAAARLVYLKEELITIEFGIKRLRQDRLYHVMLDAAEEARQGRDALTQMAGTLTRKIAKARNRLAHLS